MKYILGLSLVILLISCSSRNSKSDKKVSVKKDLTEIEIAQQTFFEVDSLLKIDNGTFWNQQMFGPILFINPETRAFISNENNAQQSFKRKGALYTGVLPDSMNISNTAINWQNKRWTMLMLPLPENKTQRNHLVIHELFHLLQPKIGFNNLYEQNNGHLDTYEGRVLLQLELEALKKVLISKEDKEFLLHLSNALAFRVYRQSNEQKKTAENSLELNEGLAEYTALQLSGRKDKEIKNHLINNIDQFYNNPTFVRSFAYQTIPIYGYLLSQKQKDWHKDITVETNLTDLFISSFAFDTTNQKPFPQIAEEYDYGYQNIVTVETKRENIRLAKIEKLKNTFLRNPTLKLNFENMNISFDPRNIIPLDNYGTVYPNIRVTDNWGILTVKEGALLASNWGSILVSEPTDFEDKFINGKGWTLELNQNWKLKKIEDGFIVIKK